MVDSLPPIPEGFELQESTDALPPIPEGFEAEQAPDISALEKAKRTALGFATGVGRGALFGQDIPAALATATSYTPFHPRYVPTEGTVGERFEAAKRAQMEAADIAAKQSPVASGVGAVTGVINAGHSTIAAG